MKIVENCPICGQTLVIETVEKLLRGGNNMAAVRVRAGVCKKCGEIVFDAATHEKLEQIRAKLEKGQIEGFQPVGQAFLV